MIACVFCNWFLPNTIYVDISKVLHIVLYHSYINSRSVDLPVSLLLSPSLFGSIKTITNVKVCTQGMRVRTRTHKDEILVLFTSKSHCNVYVNHKSCEIYVGVI